MKNFISPNSHGSTPNLYRIVNSSPQTVDVLKMSSTLTDGKRSMAIPLEVTGSRRKRAGLQLTHSDECIDGL